MASLRSTPPNWVLIADETLASLGLLYGAKHACRSTRSGTRFAFAGTMPPAKYILDGLTETATAAVAVSVGWHVVVALATAALLLGIRPHKRFAASILGAPIVSVGVLSLLFGNPFNGAIFSLLAVALAILALRARPNDPVCFASTPFAVLGSALIVFGLVYPHFLNGAPWFKYFYAAPVGVIPCPTLSLVVGAALMADAFGLTAWRLLLAATACFYALFGALRLRVLIDTVLLAGAIGLLVQYRVARSQTRSRIADISA